MRSHFNVYLDEDRLVYARAQCTDHDMRPLFFVHVIPVDEKDLSDHGRRHGYDNLDFYLMDYGIPGLQDRTCVAVRTLPDYDIASIRVGQSLYDPEKNLHDILWEGRIRLGDLTDGRRTAIATDRHDPRERPGERGP